MRTRLPNQRCGGRRNVAEKLQHRLGFAPERDPSAETEGKVLIRLTACPLRELARTHSEVVCGVHLGLIEEVLDRGGARGAIDVRMHPFVEPELCVARLELIAARREETADAATMSTGGDAEALTAPSGRVAPQLRIADPNIAKQSAQQW